MPIIFPRSTLAAACAALCAAVSAQPAPVTPSSSEPILSPITVTANPLGSSDVIAPAQAVFGTGLLLRQQSTLGEALNGLPGVSSSYFGPNASRPIIRGLDGDRIRILSNSGATIDASALSYDHAVALDPISVERIEVLRGPGALLYGGSAVGGVVNVIDNRIPKERLQGMTGKVDFGWSGGNSGKNGAFMIETGNDRFALHADVSARSSGDVSVPVSLACTNPASPATQKNICNSAADAKSGAIGGSLFFGQSRIGFSVSSFKTQYGAVAEDEVTIDMKSRRTALDADFKIGGLIESVQLQASNTRYKHTEFEGATAGTEFSNKGTDIRVQARHAKMGNLSGVIGLQLDNNRFSADGAEAFAPFSKTGQQALFIYEEAAFNWGKLSFGGRVEDVKVQSFGNPIIARFTPAERSFKPSSYAAGALFNLSPAWQLTGNFAASQRAPKDYELFADGPHIATAAYEVGDANLRKEKSTSIDVGARWKSGAHFAQINVFSSRFKNYTFLGTTGNTRGADAELNPVDSDADGVADGSGEGIFPEYAYGQVPARFSGFELSGNWRLMDTADKLDLQWRIDSTRATNTASGQALPRISPLRVGATLAWAQSSSAGAWGAKLGFDRYAAARDGSAAGYTLINAALTYTMKAKDADLLWFARVDNAGNKLAYSATSVLTTSAVGRSPLPGRSLKVGLQANF